MVPSPSWPKALYPVAQTVPSAFKRPCAHLQPKPQPPHSRHFQMNPKPAPGRNGASGSRPPVDHRNSCRPPRPSRRSLNRPCSSVPSSFPATPLRGFPQRIHHLYGAGTVRGRPIPQLTISILPHRHERSVGLQINAVIPLPAVRQPRQEEPKPGQAEKFPEIQEGEIGRERASGKKRLWVHPWGCQSDSKINYRFCPSPPIGKWRRERDSNPWKTY